MKNNNSSKKTISNFIKTIKSSIGLAWKATPFLTLIYFITNAISGVIPAVAIWAGKKIVDSLAETHGTLDDPMFHQALMYLGIALGSVILDNLLSTARTIIDDRIQGILKRYTQLELIKKSLELDLSYFESAEFYNHYEKVRQQIEDRFPGTVRDVTELFRIVIEVVSVVGMLVSINLLLLPVILLVNIPSLLWGMKYSRGKHRLNEKWLPELKNVSYLKNITTDKETVKEVKLFNLGNYLTEKFTKYFDKVLIENWKMTRKEYAGRFTTTLLADIVYYGFYLYTVVQVFLQKLTIGDIVLYTSAFSRASRSINFMLRFINSLYENALYIEDFTTFLNLKPKVVEKEDPLELTEVKSIRFDKVWFKYRPDLPYVFKNISFNVGEKENIAIVGQNGAGKTTLIKLLMRFYDVDKGAIYINDKNIKEYSLSSLWHQIGTIFQDFVKYQLTVNENIAFGQIEKINNLEEIKLASEKADADQIINKLPKKYETILGTRFDEGTDLSLGQWQRIALARAFIRDSSVIILDEPTASLDAKAEYEIFKKFTELTKDKNTFLISHRFSTVRLADRILVLEYGELIEEGTHKELLKLNGKYAEMFNLQAEGYK